MSSAPDVHGSPLPSSATTQSGFAPYAVVSLERIGRVFNGPPQVQALRDATFAVSAGEQVAIVGRSGSGKSTLLNVLGLLDSPTTGSYMLDGRPVEQLAEKDQARLRSTSIGFVFQQSFLLPYLTARENVELPLRRRRLPGSERRRRALEALKSVQLEARGDALPPTLSGGEAQRVAVARALAQEPSILLCDEPTGNLDERTSSEVTELIRKQSDRGVVVIMVTHDLALARAFPRILTVRDGVIAEGLDPRLLADGNGQRN